MLQNLLDRFRMTRLDQLDWITRNRLKMKDTIQKVSKTPTKKDGLSILFWGVMPWERGGVEHMLATAMGARGHQIHGAWCSGGIAACSMESISYPRPDCESCVARHHKLLDIWGLNGSYQPLSSYLSGHQKDELEKLVDSLPSEDLVDFQYEGLEIGRLAKKDLPQYFFKLVDENDEEVRTYLRRSIKGIASFAIAAKNCLDEVKPDRAVVTSGRTVAFTAFFQLCKLRNIPITTWDESVGGKGAFIFAQNSFAVDYHKPESWKKISEEPLTEEELNFNQTYFKNTAKGTFGRHQYYNKPIEDHQEIISSLGLDPKKPITVCLTNLTWDTSALDKEIIFDDMIHWLTETIEFFKTHPERQLVIRTHPGEAHLADYARGNESVASLLNRSYPELPENVNIVSGKEEISSHQLCEMSKTIVVYTTSVGLEMAMRGRRVLSVGKSHYRGKGFTVDIESREDYFNEIVEQEKISLHIDDEQAQLAQKYAYFFVVRTEVYLNEFNIMDRHSYEIIRPEDFLPGQSQRWDALCENLEKHGDYIDCTGYLA